MHWLEIFDRLRRDANDSAAWQALESQVRVWARLDIGGRGWDVVEDTVADTCASVVMALDRARAPETFAGFVRGHYLNARRAVLAPWLAPMLRLGETDPRAPELEPVDDRLWRALDHCLRQLPSREHTAVRLRYFEQAAYEHTAEVLNVNPGNARRIVFNGLARLRRCVRDVLAQPA
jgi:RNA polymerase sigma factor (sigma-70 family)